MTRTLSRTPGLDEVIRLHGETVQSRMRIAMPGLIVSYDNEAQKAEVLPMLKDRFVDIDGNDVVNEYPPIKDVPIVFPRTSEFFISLPVKKNDRVLLLFNERSIDNYSTGVGSRGNEPVDPIDTRMNDLSDCVAYVGFYPSNKSLNDAHPDNIVIGKTGGTQVHIKDGEVALGSENPSDAVALASKVLTELQKIEAAFNSHTHTSAAPMSPTGPPIPMPIITPPVASPASTKVKSD